MMNRSGGKIPKSKGKTKLAQNSLRRPSGSEQATDRVDVIYKAY